MWEQHSLSVIGAKIGSCKGQTAFAFLTLFLCSVAFGAVLSTTGAHIRGDSLGALNDALKLSSGSVAMNHIARELVWRRIVARWRYRLSHLPAEGNTESDALSRLQAVPPLAFPAALEGAVFVNPPVQNDNLWRARLEL